MIEVFKTNVTERGEADRLIRCIHQNFPGYKANFDLDDCDKILRVDAGANMIHTNGLVSLLKGFGYCADVLPD